MIEEQWIQEALDIALSSGADFAEVFYEDKKSQSAYWVDAHIDQVRQNHERGIGMRAFRGEQMAYSHTNILDREHILQLAHTCASAFQEKRSSIEREPLLKDEKEAFAYQEPDALEDDIRLLEALDTYTRGEHSNVAQAAFSKSHVTQKVMIANTNGIWREEERVRQRMNAQVILAENDNKQTGYKALAVSGEEPLLIENAAFELADEAARRADVLLHAQGCPTGVMPVVLASEAGGTMVHEACGHGLEADLVEKGMSVYANKIGQEVACKDITVIDDGTLIGRYGTTLYDDEGTPTQRNVLIKDGILEGYMCDLHTAYKTDAKPTGNGRRESYMHRPQTRMTTTYIAPGYDDPEQILRTLDQGLYIKQMGGGQVDTLSGDYVFEVSEGYWVEDGEIQYAVRGATLAGNGPQSLQNVQQVGNDLGYSVGVCGKGGQGVPVADAQPTLYIDNLVVGGTEQDGV